MGAVSWMTGTHQRQVTTPGQGIKQGKQNKNLEYITHPHALERVLMTLMLALHISLVRSSSPRFETGGIQSAGKFSTTWRRDERTDPTCAIEVDEYPGQRGRGVGPSAVLPPLPSTSCGPVVLRPAAAALIAQPRPERCRLLDAARPLAHSCSRPHRYALWTQCTVKEGTIISGPGQLILRRVSFYISSNRQPSSRTGIRAPANW